jgi:uncharacterized membrane protein
VSDDGSVSNANEPSSLERWSAPILVRLAAVPRWLFVIVLAAVFLAGMAVPGVVGGLLLLLITLFLAWLAALGWPRYSVGGRLLRVVVVLMVAYVAASKLFGFGTQ